MTARTTDSGFALDPAFLRDTHQIGDFPLSRVLMMNDARYTWLILVPRRIDVAEIIDLSPADRAMLLDEISLVSEALRDVAVPDKLNIGALGNMVRQLHVHCIARFVSDPAWPGPVWGHSPAMPFPPHVLGIAIDKLGAALAARGMVEIAA